MIEAGLNVVQALVILEEQTEDPYFAIRRPRAARRRRGRAAPLEAMHRHPKIFERLFVSMVEAGEAAGILDEVLDRVAMHIEKSTQIKRRVKGAMLYPLMVLSFATLVLTGLLLFLVPVFVHIFSQLGGDLPKLTQYVVNVSDLLKHRFYIIFPAFGALDLRVPQVEEDRAGRKQWDRFKLACRRSARSSSR